MELLSIYTTHLLLLVCLCLVEGREIFRIFGSIRVKRHTQLDESKLCKAIGCSNGYCRESALRQYRIVCECFPGYTGKLCDKLKCPFSCGAHGTCAIKGRALYCKCATGYSGPRCESPDKPVDPAHELINKSKMKPIDGHVVGDIIKVNGQGSWFSGAVTRNGVRFSDFHSHAMVDTSVKPDVCAPGFQCYHGICDRKAMRYGRFQCLCKKNFTGLFCEKKCTLNCKNGGTCFVVSDGHQYCACPFNFQGHYCEKRVQR